MTEADKTYRVTTVLAKMVGPYKDALIMRPAMIAVVSNGNTVGFANVYPEGDLLMADISLDYATEERLMIETRSRKLYARVDGKPHFGGILDLDMENGIPMVNFDSNAYVLQLDVHQVNLFNEPGFKDQVALGFVA